jgi:hypothetical protein
MLHCAKAILTITTLILTGACSIGGLANETTITETDAKQYLVNLVEHNSNGALALIAFEKTDGQASEFSGIKRYEIQGTAALQYVHPFLWCSEQVAIDDASILFTEKQRQLCLKTSQGAEGDKQSISVDLLFARSERRWNMLTASIENAGTAR